MNITPRIQSRLAKGLHNKKINPLCTIKDKIYKWFNAQDGNKFKAFDNLHPVVPIEDNFDSLLVPALHPSRRESEVFYTDESTVLRTHTSAHQVFLLKQKLDRFFITGDVYRKDHIDHWHSPIFHQMEVICMNDYRLHERIENLLKYLLPHHSHRKMDSTYSFTEPSWEYEVRHNGEWIEVLGCGFIHKQIMENCERGGETGWALGLGLERLAMITFGINDIRHFWSSEDRFKGCIHYTSIDEYPSHTRDIRFLVNDNFQHNEFCAYVWEKAGDALEEVKLISQEGNFRQQRHYRLKYSGIDGVLSSDEITQIHGTIMDRVANDLNVELKDMLSFIQRNFVWILAASVALGPEFCYAVAVILLVGGFINGLQRKRVLVGRI